MIFEIVNFEEYLHPLFSKDITLKGIMVVILAAVKTK